MSDHLSFSSKDSLALSSGVKSGLMDRDVSFDLFGSRVLTSAERRNLTSKGLERGLLDTAIIFTQTEIVLNGKRINFVIDF